jgi:hypothetical protein
MKPASSVVTPPEQCFDLRADAAEFHGLPVDLPGNCPGRFEQGLVGAIRICDSDAFFMLRNSVHALLSPLQ